MKPRFVYFVFSLVALMFLFVPNVSAAELDVSCEQGALINALSMANATPEADVLTLEEGCVYTLTLVNNSTEGSNGLPSISSDISIQGNGSVIQRSNADGTPAFRIFHVAESGKLTVERLTILNGWAHSEQASDPARSGGGIYSRGHVTLIQSVIADNLADFHGGGIFSRGILALNRSVISNNRADGRFLDSSQAWGWGGGIRSEQGLVTANGAVIIGNFAGSNGGGIYNAFATVTLTGTTIHNNSTVKNGGGIYNLLERSQGEMRILDSTISNNTAHKGGGIYNAVNHVMTISNSTISGNSAVDGGGIASERSGGVTLTNATVAANLATRRTAGIFNGWSDTVGTSTITLTNSIVALQSMGSNCTFPGGVVSLGNNLASDGTCLVDGINADRITSNPGLGPLGDNGGPVQTHALLTESPAIDGGKTEACPGTDQRGVLRPQGAACDIGAYEWDGDLSSSTPNLVLSNSRGAPGSYFMVTGTGFPAAAMVMISINSRPLYVLETNQTGGISFEIDTTGSKPGSHTVTLSAASAITGTFVLEADAPLLDRQNSGPLFRIPTTSTFASLPATLVIEAMVVGIPPEDEWLFLGPSGTFTIPANGGTFSFTLASGIYTVKQIVPDEYTAAAICSDENVGVDTIDVLLISGTRVACTFTNTYIDDKHMYLPLVRMTGDDMILILNNSVATPEPVPYGRDLRDLVR